MMFFRLKALYHQQDGGIGVLSHLSNCYRDFDFNNHSQIRLPAMELKILTQRFQLPGEAKTPKIDRLKTVGETV